MDRRERGSSGDAPEGVAPGTADKQVAREITKLGAACLAATKKQNTLLISDMALINDAITYHAVDSWMTVWSTINVLTDRGEVEKLIESVRPESKFHKNLNAVAALAARLMHWRNEGLISNQNSMAEAFDLLNKQLTDNIDFLMHYEGRNPTSGGNR
jgi:hypothetical protein